MKKTMPLISFILSISLLFSTNAFAIASTNINDIDVSTIQIIKDQEFPLLVEQILMEQAIISSEEDIKSSAINDIIKSSMTIQTKVANASNSFVKVNSKSRHSNKVVNINSAYCNSNYIYTNTYNNGILSQWIYFANGDIKKSVSYKLDNVTYIVINNNNISIEKDSSINHIVEEQLTDKEISTFYQLIEDGAIDFKDEYSIEDVKKSLDDLYGLKTTNKNITMYANTSCPTKTVYAPGENYTSNSATKPLTGYYIGTYCKTISGLSKYNNGSNLAKIKEYDTRKSYVESKKKKGFFDYGSDVMSIVAFAELAFSSTVSALSVAGVAIDIGSRLAAPVDFYAEREYTVSAYRESLIYDYTKENAYVELPQLYSQMAIGITYHNYIDGVYNDAWWSVISKPQFNIPSNGITSASPQQYANYVADIYYRNCVINGKWTLGRTAYGGIGG